MRRDMNKKICERPRHNDSWKPKVRHKNTPLDELPHKQSMSMGGRNGTKTFSDNLAPLRRYIEKQVGRPWNKVFSEISEHLDSGNTVQRHVLQHIDGYIAINVQLCDVSESETGMVYHNALADRQYYDRRIPVKNGALYVDPLDGIIKRAKLRVKKQHKSSSKPSVIDLGNNQLAVMESGIWYSVDIIPYTIREDWYWYSFVMMQDRYHANRQPYKTGQMRKTYIIEGRQLDYLPNGVDIGRHFSNNWTLRKAFPYLVNAKYVLLNKKQLSHRQLQLHDLKNS